MLDFIVKKGVIHLVEIKGRNPLVLTLLLLLLISVCALCVSGASVLLSEIVSRESHGDSHMPSIAVGTDGIVYAVWEDDTDFASSTLGRSETTISRDNGPDRDIFYNYRENGSWSTPSLVDNEMVGGAEILTNSSMTSSTHPHIAVDSDNVSHVVWSSLIIPEQLSADSHTTFLAPFDGESSSSLVSHAGGSSSSTSTGSGTSLTSNALSNKSLLFEGSDGYIEFSSDGNFNNTIGTIEMWFNLGKDIQRKTYYGREIIFKAYNSSKTSDFFGIVVGGYHQPSISSIITGTRVVSSEPSYIYPFRGNEWHHLALTYNMTDVNSSEFNIYIDGYHAGSNTLALNSSFRVDTLRFGGNTLWSKVRIDEVMLSDTIRSAGVIKSHAGNRSLFYLNITNKTKISNIKRLTSGNNLSYYPRVAADSSNNVHLVYNQLHNRSSLSVMYMMRNSTGWSEPELVSNGTFLAYMPDIAVNVNKTAEVVWEEFSPDNHNMSWIHYERKNFSGHWHDETNVSNASHNIFSYHDYYNRQTISSYFPKRPRIISEDSNMTRVVWADNANYPDKGLVFYESFDNNYSADYSAGSNDAAYSGISSVQGTEGNSHSSEFYHTQAAVNISDVTYFRASLSPLNYNGIDFDDCVLYYDSSGNLIRKVEHDGHGLGGGVTGDNNFTRLWLYQDDNTPILGCGSDAYATVFVEEGHSTDCSSVASNNGGTCHYAAEGGEVWTANGRGNNYTFNSSILNDAPVAAGYTGPPYLASNVKEKSHLNYSAVSNLNISKGAISMWVKPYFDPNSDYNSTNVLFYSGFGIVPRSDNSMTIYFKRYGGFYHLLIQFRDKNSDLYAESIPTANLNQDDWFHLGISWDVNNASGNREVLFSIDGEKIPIPPNSSYPDNNDPVAINDSYSRFLIGAMYNITVGEYHNITNGSIDEVKIYNTTRTAEQFRADMLEDHDILYREKNSTAWSEIRMISENSNRMSLNPSIAEYGTNGDYALLEWSDAEGSCDLTSDRFPYCTFFSSAYSVIDPNNVLTSLGVISDESTGGTFYPDIDSYSTGIYHIWEDHSTFSGEDMDIMFRETKTSARPRISLTSNLDGRTFKVDDPSSPKYVKLNATASDSDNTVKNVTFYYTMDGVAGRVACIDTASPYSCDWNIVGIAEDFYKIKAIVTSDDGGRNWTSHDNYLYLDTLESVETYVMNASSNNAGYKKGYTNWSSPSRPNVSSGSLGAAMNSSELARLSSLDDVYEQTDRPPFCEKGDFVNAQTYLLVLNESASDIDTLDLYWEGRGYKATNYYTNLSVWNYNTSSWEPLKHKDFTKEKDDYLRYTLSSNIGHYVSSNNSVYILVETQDIHEYSTCSIFLSVGAGCPIYSSWNGTDFVYETDGLLGLLNRRMESATYDRLSRLKPEKGLATVRVSEILPEVLYLNHAELIRVGHPDDVIVYLDSNGTPRTISNDSMMGVRCVDSRGSDCTGLVEKADEAPQTPQTIFNSGLVSSRSATDNPPVDYNGSAWVSDINSLDLGKDTHDYLYITLPEPEQVEGTESPEKGKLVIKGSETGLMSFSVYSLFALGKESLPVIYSAIDNTFLGSMMEEKILDSASITVQVLDEKGEWVDYSEGGHTGDGYMGDGRGILGPYSTLVMPLNMSLVRGNRLRLRMTAFAYMIDFIGIDYSDDAEVSVETYKPRRGSLSALDSSRITVSQGEHIDIRFDVDEGETEAGREEGTYFLSTSGYYHPFESLVPGSADRSPDSSNQHPPGIMDIMKAFYSTPAYGLMYADSGYAKKQLIKAYLDTDFSTIISDAEMFMNETRKQYNDSHAQDRTAEYGSLVKEHAGQDEIKKHNTLYSDFVKVTVSTCVVPTNNMEITSDTTFCRGTYYVPDYDYTLGIDQVGILQIKGSNLTVDCNKSTFIGGGDERFGKQKGAGVAIGVNFSSNVVVKNCNITGYEYAIAMNKSNNVTVKDNYMIYNDVGIGGEGTNNSHVYNNTVEESGLAAYALIGGSFNNTVENNTAINSFSGVALETAHNNTIYNNNISAAGRRLGKAIVGIALFGQSRYNHIDMNFVNNTPLGAGLGDAGKFLEGFTGGYGGMWNNFSRNTLNNTAGGLGLLFPYTEDYYNYFEQSNTVNGEPVYYYLNQHGTPSDYIQIKNLDLRMGNVTPYRNVNVFYASSLFMGKITLVNSSYVNITNNTLANNFYGLFMLNSSNITVSNNRLKNTTDLMNLYSSMGEYTGAGAMIRSSEDITFFNNTAENNLFGFLATNNSRGINFTANTAKNDTIIGFGARKLIDSYFINNNASNDTSYGIYLDNSSGITLSGNHVSKNKYGIYIRRTGGEYTNNTIIENSIAGLVFYKHATELSGNTIENNTGSGVLIWNVTSGSYDHITAFNNTKGIYILNSRNISLLSPNVTRNEYGIFINGSNNVNITNLYSENNSRQQVYFKNSRGNRIIDSVMINNVSECDFNSTSKSHNYVLNTTFNRSATCYGDAFSNLSVQWHLDFYVEENESALVGESIPIKDVDITVWPEGYNTDISTLYTNKHGYAFFNVSEYREDTSGREYFSNYTWNITRVGYNFSPGQINAYITETNMTDNKHFNISMILAGGIEDTNPPTNPVVVDGANYIDIDWFSSRSTLSASWYNSTDRHLIFYNYRILENGTCIKGYCAETSVNMNTSVTVNGLNLTEGMNYTFAVRARDTLYWFTPLIFSDGAVADFTKPNITVNSTTHPNQSMWYNNPNATFTFYGNDSLSGVAGYSYTLDQNAGTGPDLIAEEKAEETLKSIKNDGYSTVLKTNGTGEAFAVFSEVDANISAGDNITLTFQLSEDTSDTIDTMSATAYLVDTTEGIRGYQKTPPLASARTTISRDITHKPYSSADTYSVTLTASKAAQGFYAVIEGQDADDNNTHNLSIAGSDRESDIDNSTEVHVCGETSGCTNLTGVAEYAIEVKRKKNNTLWEKTYYNLDNGAHYFHVRAVDRAGNWGNPAHYKIQVDAVAGAPSFELIKPKGYVVSTNPTLAVRTNEYATCYYNTTGSGYTKMTSYDGLYHEKDLNLSEGTFTYGFNCTDRSGNSAYNSTSFVIDPSAEPDRVEIWPMANYTAGKTISVNVNVTKEYNGVYYGLGEISSGFSANLTNSSDTYGVSVDVTDKGGGVYQLKFRAPLVAGTYTLWVEVDDARDSEGFKVNSYSLTMKYSGTLARAVERERMVYGKVEDEYITGVASDTDPVSLTGSTGLLQLKYSAAQGNGFIFITSPIADVGSKSSYLNEGAFLDLDNPSFGQPVKEEEHVVSTILSYNDLHIIGDDRVQAGRYSIIIKNSGINTSSGKPKITISII